MATAAIVIVSMFAGAALLWICFWIWVFNSQHLP